MDEILERKSVECAAIVEIQSDACIPVFLSRKTQSKNG
jgi:hypothetical protein